MTEKSAPTEAVSEPVPSPRPAEEIRSPVDIDHLVEQLSVQNFRPIRSELYAALSELRQHRTEVERLSAELADARAELTRVRAQRDNARSADLRCRVERDQLRAQVAAIVSAAEDTARRIPSPFADNVLYAVRGAALSAASPTTSDDVWEPCEHGVTHGGHDFAEDTEWGVNHHWCPGGKLLRPATSDAEERAWPRLHPEAVRQHERATVALDGSAGPSAASDETARCPHGSTERHTYCPHNQVVGTCWDWRSCPGPAASGTPETTA